MDKLEIDKLFEVIKSSKKDEIIQDLISPDSNDKVQNAMPKTGSRFALRNVRKQLTDDELAQTGTQKLLLDMLEESECEKANFKEYISKYHESDKNVAILNEKLITNKALDIFFGVGIGLGGAIFGLAPFFWSDNSLYGIICICIGLCLIIGSCIGRALKK